FLDRGVVRRRVRGARRARSVVVRVLARVARRARRGHGRRLRRGRVVLDRVGDLPLLRGRDAVPAGLRVELDEESVGAPGGMPEDAELDGRAGAESLGDGAEADLVASLEEGFLA